MRHVLVLLLFGTVLCSLAHAADRAINKSASPTVIEVKQSASSARVEPTTNQSLQATTAAKSVMPATTGLKTNRLFTVSMFMAIVAATIGILFWAAGRNKTAADYYAAGGGISGLQNGWAIAGDTLSAATFLGSSGLIALYGLDGFMYAAGPTVSFLTILLIIAEPCRNAGKYTLGDILAFRSKSKVVRGSSAISTVILTSFFLLVQMVGAGKLMQLLLGISYQTAVISVGTLIVVYVSFGGMRATTLVQVIKAALLVGTGTVLAIAVLWKSGMNPVNLLESVASSMAIQDHTRALLKHVTAEPGYDYGQRFLEMGLFLKDPVESISLGIAIILGVAGLPHIIMRFFTVPNAKEARKSVVIAMSLIAFFLFFVTFLGLGAALYVTPQQVISVDKGGNLAVLMLTQFIGGGVGTIGGDLALAFICAVAFATIFAVVSGLVLAASAAISHDLYVNIIKNGKADQKEQVKVAKISSFAVGFVAIALSIACEKQNVVVLATLCYAVAASSNLPVILFALFWKRLNTAGIVAGLVIGSVVTIGLVMVSPNMTYPKKVAADAKKIVDTLEKKQLEGVILADKDQRMLEKARGDYAKNKDEKSLLGLDAPLFPLKNPAIVTVPIGFAATIFASLLFRRRSEEEMFNELYVRQNTGFGIGEVAEH